MAVDRLDKRKTPDIKFPLLVERWCLYVFLNDKSPLRVTTLRFNDVLNVFHFCLHSDAHSSVSVLSRLHDPDVLDVLGTF